MEKDQQYVKYIYKKYKNAPIPYGTRGKILFRVSTPASTKLIVDFGQYGKAIVPLSAVKSL